MPQAVNQSAASVLLQKIFRRQYCGTINFYIKEVFVAGYECVYLSCYCCMVESWGRKLSHGDVKPDSLYEKRVKFYVPMTP